MGVESKHALAGAHGAPDALLADLRIEVTELEALQPVLRRELADDLYVEIDAAVRAGVAGGPGDNRHAERARGEQHLLEVVRLPRERAGGSVAAERNRPDVVAAGVRGDVVRLGRHAELEAFDADRREAEVPVRADDLERFHARAKGRRGIPPPFWPSRPPASRPGAAPSARAPCRVRLRTRR